jgi:WD40 repeat protein
MNADGSFFTLVNQGGQARMWSLRGHQRYTLTSAGPQVKTVRYSPDGRFLATLTNNNILELWHLDFPRSPHKIHQWSRVQDVQFSQDAQRLVWLEQDAQRGQVIQVRSLNPLRLDQGHTFTTPESSRNTLSTLQLSPDSHHIAIQSDTGRVYIWNLLEGQFLDLRPHAKPLKKITLHPFLNTFVTTDTEGEIRYWQGEKNLWRHKLEAKQDSAEVYLTQFSPDGKSLITAQWGGILQIWDAQTGTPDPINTHLKQTPIKGKILSVAFNPSFDSSTNPLSLILLVERPDSSLFFQSWTNQWQQTPPIDFNVHQEGIREATFIPGTPWLQTISWGGIGRLWNTQGQSLAKIQNHYGRIHSMTVSPDHRWLVTAGRDGTAKFWSLDSTSALMEQSCQWLSLRLTSTSSLDPQEKICPNTPTAPRQKNP